MTVRVALIRGIVRHTTKEIGNFWVDMTRLVLYILLPLSLVLVLALTSALYQAKRVWHPLAGGVKRKSHPWWKNILKVVSLGYLVNHASTS